MRPATRRHAGSDWSPSVSALLACIRATTTASTCSPGSRLGRSAQRWAIASRDAHQTPDVSEATAAGLARVPSRIVRQTSLVTAAYLAATAVLIVLLGRAILGWPAIVTAHVAVCVVLMSLRRRTPLPRSLNVGLDWHTLALF